MSETNDQTTMRPSWDAYFMKVATDVATRATCPRKHVGAVIVKDKRILSTGYNGSPRGMPHCTEVGCEMKDLGGRQSCIRTIHSEANAIAQAAQNGVSIDGATIYTTASPCYDCSKLILNAGIKKIVYGEFYGGRYGMSEEMVKFLTVGGASVDSCESEISKLDEAKRMVAYFEEHKILDGDAAKAAIARAEELLGAVAKIEGILGKPNG